MSGYSVEPPVWMFGVLLAAAVSLWLGAIGREVEGIYLDEEFHVRQSLVYYANKFRVWDPKITTPPGLYVLSYLWLHGLAALKAPGTMEMQLRALNGLAILVTWDVTRRLLVRIEQRRRVFYSTSVKRGGTPRLSSIEHKIAAHSAFNIALFPPLFFFSGLFYTDVVSSLLVVVSHVAFYENRKVFALIFSLSSLTLRQTNVFWTGVYLAALEVQKAGHEKESQTSYKGGESWSEVMNKSFASKELYEVSIDCAYLEDYAKCTLSFVLVALSKAKSLSLSLIPHVIVVASFAAFVAWNGGVVLGDKSNHVASLHFPQMLYIWPYIAFFSLPQVLIGSAGSVIAPGDGKGASYPRLVLILPFIAAALVAAHFNTIIHPFTLADNRHYTFYVFRIFRKISVFKYLAAPVYVVLGWASILCLGGDVPYPPKSPPSAQKVKRLTGQEGRKGSTTGTALVWVAVTMLSVITAPLVEPRYFILPWLFWRANLPMQTDTVSSPSSGPEWLTKLFTFLRVHVLWLETIWMGIVNLATIFIFLNWTFEWENEPGKKMRFMW